MYYLSVLCYHHCNAEETAYLEAKCWYLEPALSKPLVSHLAMIISLIKTVQTTQVSGGKFKASS